MITIQCPHCNVSLDGEAEDGDQIECPSCGRTFVFKAPRKFAVASQKPTTIERTSKKYKVCTIVAWVLILSACGVFILAYDSKNEAALGFGALLFLIGAGFGLYAKIGSWWNNG